MAKRLRRVLNTGMAGIFTSDIVEKRQEVVKILTDNYTVDVDPAVKDSLPFTSEVEKIKKLIEGMPS